MRTEIVEQLRSSGLAEAVETIREIESGAPIDIVGEAFLIVESFIRIYETRTKINQSRQDLESQRLASSLKEFSDNLPHHLGGRARWVFVGNRSEWRFMCCALEPGQLIIGCMRVREGGPWAAEPSDAA